MAQKGWLSHHICCVCGTRRSAFGFGPPYPYTSLLSFEQYAGYTVWACSDRAHQAVAEERAGKKAADCARRPVPKAGVTA